MLVTRFSNLHLPVYRNAALLEPENESVRRVWVDQLADGADTRVTLQHGEEQLADGDEGSFGLPAGGQQIFQRLDELNYRRNQIRNLIHKEYESVEYLTLHITKTNVYMEVYVRKYTKICGV